jgi:rhomboid protease GluP
MVRYPGTTLLLASVLLLFGVELATGAVGSDVRLLSLGAIADSGSLGTDYWRLLTYAWLHAGYVHLVTNAGLLWWVGRIVERRVRSFLMLGIYLACVLAGGLLIVWNASNHPHPGVSLGASAGVSGLLTCALVLLHRPSAAGFGQPIWLRVLLWAILLLGLGISFLPGVSLAGHLGGLALGALFGCLVPIRSVDARDVSNVVPDA